MAIQALFDYASAGPTAEPARCLRSRIGREVRAVDLHCHSRFSAYVSPHMVFENIIPCACWTGLDILGTGDCLQRDWLYEIKTKLVETGSGLLRPTPELEAACFAKIPERFHRPIHFLLSTEVSCVPSDTPYARGQHHLIYFRSIDSVHRFQARMRRFGNLQRGRPALRLTSRQLLEQVLDHGDGAALAPAHVLSPGFACLGSRSEARTLEDVFGDLVPHVFAIEVGITATPSMCRRLSSLDRHALFCCSDAHSLKNLGREYTLIDCDLSYDGVLGAIGARVPSGLRQLVKFPVEACSGYWNFCPRCRHLVADTICAACRHPTLHGSRTRTMTIADRSEEAAAAVTPAFQPLLPLRRILSLACRVKDYTPEVQRLHRHLLQEVGPERHILATATEAEIAVAATPEIARTICQMRRSPPSFTPEAIDPNDTPHDLD